MKTGIAAALGGLCIVALSWIVYSHSASSISPELEFQLIDGRRLQLPDLENGPVLVTFWATSCATCVKKTPELVQLYRDLNPRGVEMIAVAMAYDPPNRILDFSRLNSIPYPISLDLDGEIAKAFNDVSLTPSTFLLDQHGRIIFSRVGDIDVENLRSRIIDLLSSNSATG